MIDVLNIQPNKPMANLSDYTTLIFGQGKAGKTTLFYEIVKEHFDGDMSKALLIGLEKGYKSLPNIHAVDVTSWKEFNDLVSQLIENKDDVPYKLLGLDTLDYMYQYAVEYVIKRERRKPRKEGQAKIENISDIPWGQGWSMVEEIMTKTINKLIMAGYGVVMITHETEKKFKSKDGSEWEKITLSLPAKVRKSIVNMCDFIMYVAVEKVKDGDELVDNRVIYLRSDSDIEAGSRFQKIPEKINYSASEFLKAFENAVLDSYDHDEQAVEQAKEEQAIEKEEQAKEFIKQETKQNTVEDMTENISSKIKEMTKDAQSEVKKMFKEHFGSVNYKKFKDDQLEKAIELLEEMKSEG